MSHLDNKRILLELSDRTRRPEQLSKEESMFLASALQSIANGEDANNVFEIRPKRGQSDADALARQKLSFIMHWIACAIKPINDPISPGLGLSVEKACEEAFATVVPVADNMFGNSKKAVYDADYLKKCWYQHDKKHMQDINRNSYHPDYPYY